MPSQEELLQELLASWDYTFYRGTQRRSIKGVRKSLSFTPSLPVAVIWSAVPGDAWGQHAPEFLPTSTIHTMQLLPACQPLLLGNPLPYPDNALSLAHVLVLLKYGKEDGITEAEVRKIYNYLHNRITGKTSGGDFLYRVFNEYMEEMDDEDIPWDFTHPHTMISYIARDAWDDNPTVTTAENLEADAFIFADAPAVQKAAIRLGYDSLLYVDAFGGGEYAAPPLLGCPVADLSGVEIDYGMDNELVPTHWTLRLLNQDCIESMTPTPTDEIVGHVDLCGEE